MFSLNNRPAKLGFIAGVIGVSLLFSLVLSLPVMWLWNSCLVPAVSGVNEIGWLQAWGLMILAALFFKTSISPKE